MPHLFSDQHVNELKDLFEIKISEGLKLERCLSKDAVYLDTLRIRNDFEQHFYEKTIERFNKIQQLREQTFGKCGKIFLQCSIERHSTKCLFRLFGCCTNLGENHRTSYLIEVEVKEPKQITYEYLMSLLDRENITLNVVGISTFGDRDLDFDTHHFPKVDVIVPLSCCLMRDIDKNPFGNVLETLYVYAKRELNIPEPQPSPGHRYYIQELGNYLTQILASIDSVTTTLIKKYMGLIEILISISHVYTEAYRQNKLGYFVENIPNIRQQLTTQNGYFEETLQFLSDENWGMYEELCRTYPWLPFRPPYMNRDRAINLMSFNSPEEFKLTEQYFFSDLSANEQ
ncbi:unnamed protein product [Dimorphilus gyrociliatus]|uniref:Uncharacterized protein n=1 Tax=Dimorphilus gyrociliatus TaxID=2664684 RepID=A0A7I8VDK9_9ANNE|nr:unnamed protein product [Dimorphilus gyrociliatus]